MIIKGVPKKDAKGVQFSDARNSVNSFGKKGEYSQESEAVSPISAVEILEKGVGLVTENAGKVWDGLKNDWQHNRISLAKKAAVGVAITGTVVGLLILSARKKKKTFFENALAAI